MPTSNFYLLLLFFFFFNDTATTEIYTLSLHDALPIWRCRTGGHRRSEDFQEDRRNRSEEHTSELQSHSFISYAVFCLKKKKQRKPRHRPDRIQLGVGQTTLLNAS